MAPEPAPDMPGRITRARDAAHALPFVGLFLLLPPVLGLFAVPLDLAGVPLLVIYLFAVWLGLIVAAALLARALGPRTPAADEPPPRA